MAERYARRGAPETITVKRDRERLIACHDRADQLRLECQTLDITVALQHRLKCKMSARVEWMSAALAITRRVGWIAMGTRHPIFRQWLCCGVRAAVCDELGQDMRVRTFGTFSIRRRYWLKNLDATHAAHKDTMRTGLQDDAHRAAIGCEYGFPDVPSQRGSD